MSFNEADYFWMQQAISLAEKAAISQEVPIGAVLVLEDKKIGEGWNQPIGQCDPSSHAEIVALREGAKTIGNYRLLNATLYVTLEPCIMCVGALIHARVKKVIFGAYDPKGGGVESVFQLGGTHKLNHAVEYEGGLLAESCGKILSDFFRARR
jgi:tRNA(adenine34) deaminase